MKLLLIALLTLCACSPSSLQTQERVAFVEADALTAISAALHQQMYLEWTRLDSTARSAADHDAVIAAARKRFAPVRAAYTVTVVAFEAYVSALRYAETFAAEPKSPSLEQGVASGVALARSVLTAWSELLAAATEAGLTNLPTAPKWLVAAGGAP